MFRLFVSIILLFSSRVIIFAFIPTSFSAKNAIIKSPLHRTEDNTGTCLGESTSSSKILFLEDHDDKKSNGRIQQSNAFGKEEWYLRFSGVGRLYATEQSSAASSKHQSPEHRTSVLPPHLEVVERLAASSVTVVGLGGVGSWAAEALCRSGIGTLFLIDLDDICISNTNRQLHATSTTVGRMKLDEMKRRLIDINPQCNITLIHDFISADNVHDILDSCGNVTVLLDAMDGTNEKSALMAACVQRRIPIVTCGAAAGRMDPTAITVDDLTNVENDRLLATCRRNLRKLYNFDRGLSFSEKKKTSRKIRKWGIQAVFSNEVQANTGCRDTKSNDNISSFRVCDGPLGTACFVTGSYGFVAASKIVEMIARNKLVYPKKRKPQ